MIAMTNQLCKKQTTVNIRFVRFTVTEILAYLSIKYLVYLTVKIINYIGIHLTGHIISALTPIKKIKLLSVTT